MLPSDLRSLLAIGPGPDNGGSILNQRPHMPDKSGMDVAFSLPLSASASVGTTACPKGVVAAAAANVATKRKCRRCKFMPSSLFPELQRKLSHQAKHFASALGRERDVCTCAGFRTPARGGPSRRAGGRRPKS